MILFEERHAKYPELVVNYKLDTAVEKLSNS